MENDLEEIISNSRKELQNGSVVYDLTDGIDLKHPSRLAKAISKVIFQQDISKWFKFGEKELEFAPGYKLEIRLQKDHHSAILKTLKDLSEDLKNDQVKTYFKAQIDTHVHSNLQENLTKTYFAGASMAMALDAATEITLEGEFLGKLMSEIAENIKVVAV